jgi:hypothetical protein
MAATWLPPKSKLKTTPLLVEAALLPGLDCETLWSIDVCLVGIAASGYLRLTQPVSRPDIEVNQGLTYSHLCPAAPFAIIIAISVFWARRSILCPTL